MDSSEDHLGGVPVTSRPMPAARRPLYARVAGALARWQARRRSRRLLAGLDERMLRDIGVDPARVWQETGKWVWEP